jgi:hypothetical protein
MAFECCNVHHDLTSIEEVVFISFSKVNRKEKKIFDYGG